MTVSPTCWASARQTGRLSCTTSSFWLAAPASRTMPTPSRNFPRAVSWVTSSRRSKAASSRDAVDLCTSSSRATSDGKVLLAYLSEGELTACLAPPLARFTDRTITAAAEFGDLLAEVRRRDYATAVEELEAGLTAIAAPVRNAEGKVIASISASGPSFRIPAERIPALAAALGRAAAEVSRRLGWTDARAMGVS